MKVKVNSMKLEEMADEQLRRKADQAWEMAGLARQDRDYKDADRRTKEARAYERELQHRSF